MYVVIVDTRGMSPSQIEGYEERTCTQKFFDEHVLDNPKVRCTKSKVAELCGLDMKIYFHEHLERHGRLLQDPPEVAISHEEEDLYPLNLTNGAATLLTFDHRTGFPEFKIFGKAYVVVDGGDYPLSIHQVWGIQELISEARDLYYCDPDHLYRGRRDLLRWCREYREEKWGPLTIYEPRLVESDDPNYDAPEALRIIEGYYFHRHMMDNCKNPDNLRFNDENAMQQPSAFEHTHSAKTRRFPMCSPFFG